MELKNVYFELPPEKHSKKILEQISQDLEKLFSRKGIEAKIQKNHHMTIAYFQQITAAELAKVIETLHTKKLEYQGIQTLNKNSTFDQSIHQVNIRKSNITGKTHLVLTPHNENALYNNIIQSTTIQTPHISLAQISGEQEIVENMKEEIKRLIKPHIQKDGIAADLSDIIFHF